MKLDRKPSRLAQLNSLLATATARRDSTKADLDRHERRIAELTAEIADERAAMAAELEG